MERIASTSTKVIKIWKPNEPRGKRRPNKKWVFVMTEELRKIKIVKWIENTVVMSNVKENLKSISYFMHT